MLPYGYGDTALTTRYGRCQGATRMPQGFGAGSKLGWFLLDNIPILPIDIPIILFVKSLLWKFKDKNQVKFCQKRELPIFVAYKCKQIVKQHPIDGYQNELTVGYENNEKKMDSVFSKRIKAGKRRTYFFDVKATKGNDYFLTITESRRKFNDDGYDRHKIFLYKEDFNKFVRGLGEAVDYVKTELMPDFDFDAFNHEYPEGYEGDLNGEQVFQPKQAVPIIIHTTSAIPAKEVEEKPIAPSVYSNAVVEEVDKW